MRPGAQVIVPALAVDMIDDNPRIHFRGVVKPILHAVLHQEVLAVGHAVPEIMHHGIILNPGQGYAGFGMHLHGLHKPEHIFGPGGKVGGTFSVRAVPRTASHDPPIPDAVRGAAVIIEVRQAEKMAHFMTDHTDTDDAGTRGKPPQGRLRMITHHVDAVLSRWRCQTPLVRPDTVRGIPAVFLPVAGVDDG